MATPDPSSAAGARPGVTPAAFAPAPMVVEEVSRAVEAAAVHLAVSPDEVDVAAASAELERSLARLQGLLEVGR